MCLAPIPWISDEDLSMSIIFKTESPSSHHSNQIRASVELDLDRRRDEGEMWFGVGTRQIVPWPIRERIFVIHARDRSLDVWSLAGTSKLRGGGELHTQFILIIDATSVFLASERTKGISLRTQRVTTIPFRVMLAGCDACRKVNG